MTLYEKTEAVKSIWNQIVRSCYTHDPGFVTEIPIPEVHKWLIKEGIVADKEKAKRAIQQEVGKLRLQSEGLMLYEEFTRMFTKGVIKNALHDVAERFNQMMKKKGADVEDLPVGRKIDQYAR